MNREKIIERENRVRGRALYELRKRKLSKEEVILQWSLLEEADKEIEIQKAYMEQE